MTYQYIPFMAKIIRSPTRQAKHGSIAAEESGQEGQGKAKPNGQAQDQAAGAKPRSRRKSPKPSKPWTPAEVREAFERFRKANPEPKGELEHLNPFTLLVAVVLSAQATDAGVNRATRELFKVADTPQKMLELGEERLRDYIKTIGLYRNKAKNVIALSQKLITDFGGEVPRTRAEIEVAAGRGPQDRQCRAQHGLWRAHHGGRHPCVPRRQSHRARARQDAARSRARTGEDHPVRIHAACPSLADPAWPLHLSRAQAALRAMPDQRSLPLAGKDGLRHDRAIVKGELRTSPLSLLREMSEGCRESAGSSRPGSCQRKLASAIAAPSKPSQPAYGFWGRFAIPLFAVLARARLCRTGDVALGRVDRQRRIQVTDDAYVRADLTRLSSRVAGEVLTVALRIFSASKPASC